MGEDFTFKRNIEEGRRECVVQEMQKKEMVLDLEVNMESRNMWLNSLVVVVTGVDRGGSGLCKPL